MPGFLNQILKSLFPRKCVSCGKEDFWVCEKCVAEITKTNDTPFPWINPVFEYKNKTIRKAVWFLKFTNKYSVLGDLEFVIRENFAAFLKKVNLEGEEIILIPVPITKQSLRKRKYNQSLLIAKILKTETSSIKIENKVLVKTKNHQSQNKIKNRYERLRNVVGSFEIKKKEKIKGKNIILIDDVTTTGATLLESRKVLLKAGARKVFAFTLAH